MQIDNPVTSGDAATPARDGFYNLAKATFAFTSKTEGDDTYNEITTTTTDSVTTPSITYFWHSAAAD